MKKLLKSALLSAAMAGSISSLHALPVGNPSEPSLLIDGTIWEGAPADPCDPCATWCDAISLRVGFYGDYVFDRILKVDAPKNISMGVTPTVGASPSNYTTPADRPNPAYNKHLHDAEWFTNAGFLALNIWDRFDVFCTLGASNGYIKGNSASFNLVGLIGVAGTSLGANELPNVSLGNGIVELYTDTTFAWSVGARGALWECGCATLGAEFQYAQSKPKVEEINVICNVAQFHANKPKGYKGTTSAFPLPVDAGTTKAANTKSAIINYHEWQVGAALSYRLNSLVPYIGVQWSRATFDADTIRIAQPKLATAILNLTSWNPTLLGQATTVSSSDKFSDFMQIVSCQINKLKSRKACGVTLGATLVDADKWSVTGEVRLINERAAHVSGQFRF